MDTVSPTHTAMTAGAITAGLMFLVLVIGLQILGWIVFVGGIYYAMKHYRKEIGGGITYFKALNCGVQTAFFVSVICAFFIYLSATLEPSQIEKILDASEQLLITYNFPPALIEDLTQQMRTTLTPFVLGVFTIFMYSAAGCIAGVVCAFFTQKEQPQPAQ